VCKQGVRLPARRADHAREIELHARAIDIEPHTLIEMIEHTHMRHLRQPRAQSTTYPRRRSVPRRFCLSALNRRQERAWRIVGIQRLCNSRKWIEEPVRAQPQPMLAAVRDVRTARQVIEQQQAEIRARTGDKLALFGFDIVRILRVVGVRKIRARIRDQLGQRTQPTYTARRISFETVNHGKLCGRCVKRA
jgi:hypothetical protein